MELKAFAVRLGGVGGSLMNPFNGIERRVSVKRANGRRYP